MVEMVFWFVILDYLTVLCRLLSEIKVNKNIQ
jgi:hypothetical protein